MGLSAPIYHPAPCLLLTPHPCPSALLTLLLLTLYLPSCHPSLCLPAPHFILSPPQPSFLPLLTSHPCSVLCALPLTPPCLLYHSPHSLSTSPDTESIGHSRPQTCPWREHEARETLASAQKVSFLDEKGLEGNASKLAAGGQLMKTLGDESLKAVSSQTAEA